MNTACSDEDDFYTNDFGSSIEIKKNVKISEFSLDSVYWKIPDSASYIKVVLHSLADDIAKEYDVEVQYEKKNRLFRLMIPKAERISDGDYLMEGFSLEGRTLGHNFKVSFKDEMLEYIISATVTYPFKGTGTEKDPYLIQSEKDFGTMLKILCIDDTIVHASGLHFLQTVPHIVAEKATEGVFNDHLYTPQAFAGVYDGGGNSIQFAIIESFDVSGLFTILFKGAEICNLNILGNISGAGNETGIIAGRTIGKVSIHDVNIENTSYIRSDNSKTIGGMIGLASGDVEIKNCKIGGKYRGLKNVGGLIGMMTNGLLTVENVSNGGSKEFVVSTKKSFGGLVAGRVSGGIQFNNIQFDSPEVLKDESSVSFIGGLIGDFNLRKESSVKNISITTPLMGNDCTGGYFGYICGNNSDSSILRIESCTLCNSIKADYDYAMFHDPVDFVGGLIGEIVNSRLELEDITTDDLHVKGGQYTGMLIGGIKKCGFDFNRINLTSSSTLVGMNSTGGLVGFTDQSRESKVRNITLDTSVTGDTFVGGLFGYLEYTNPLHLESCVVSGRKVSGIDCTGGFFGKVCKTGDSELFIGNSSGSCEIKVDTIYSSNNNVGGLAGFYQGDLDPKGKVNILVNKLLEGKECVGGVLGYFSDGKFKAIHKNISLSDNQIIKGNKQVGGLIGKMCNAWVEGENNLQLNQFTDKIPEKEKYIPLFKGTVASPSNQSSGAQMGGLIGNAEGSTVKGLCFSGSLKEDYEIGGIVGSAYNTVISSCINKSKLCEGKGNNVGGIAGLVRTDLYESEYLHNLNYSYIKGNENTGGIFGGFFEEKKSGEQFKLNMKYFVNVGEVKGRIRVGGCIGYIYSDDKEAFKQEFYFRESANYGKVSNTSSSYDDEIGNAGGLIGDGESNALWIKYSVNHGEVFGNTENSSDKKARVGGIVGHLGIDPSSSSNYHGGGFMNSCCNFGQVHANTPDNAQVGGLIGYKEEGSSWGEIYDCYNAGNITSASDGENNGGIVGFADWNIEINRCYNVGKVTDGSGIVGDHKATSHPGENNCFILIDSDTETSKKHCVSAEQLRDKSTFETYDFSLNWDINSSTNNGFPYLKYCPFQFVTK